MDENYAEFNQKKWQIDLNAAKWFGWEMMDSVYLGPCNSFLFKQECNYKQAYGTIVGYWINYKDQITGEEVEKYIPGYLDKDIPFWQSVEEALISCINEYIDGAKRHPDDEFYPSVVDAAETILEYLVSGYL